MMDGHEKPITILMDDDDDRLMTKEALEVAQLYNDLRFVEDSEGLVEVMVAHSKNWFSIVELPQGSFGV